MLTVITQAISNGAFGIYFPKFIGSIYEVLSAPISAVEIVVGYVGAAATNAIFTGLPALQPYQAGDIKCAMSEGPRGPRTLLNQPIRA